MIGEADLPKAHLPAAFLHQCRQVGAFHLCETPLFAAANVTDCATLLYKGNMAEAILHCPIQELSQDHMTFASVNRTSFMLFSPEKISLLEQCPGHRVPELFEVQGLRLISSEPHCHLRCAQFEVVLGGHSHLHQDVQVTIFEGNLTLVAPKVTQIPLLSPLPKFDGSKFHQDLTQIENQPLFHSDFKILLSIIVGVVLIALTIFGFVLFKC